MSANDSIVELLRDLLAPLGAFKARRMFGGHGLYLNGTFFAIVDDGVGYFKVSDATRRDFEAEGMGPFTHQTKTGEHALTSYWRLPERLYDAPDELVVWAHAAVEVAHQAGAAKAAPRAAKRSRTKTM